MVRTSDSGLADPIVLSAVVLPAAQLPAVVALVAMAIFKQADQSFQLFETNVTRRSLGRGQAIICTTI